jgi:hypothetical protein
MNSGVSKTPHFPAKSYLWKNHETVVQERRRTLQGNPFTLILIDYLNRFSRMIDVLGDDEICAFFNF